MSSTESDKRHSSGHEAGRNYASHLGIILGGNRMEPTQAIPTGQAAGAHQPELPAGIRSPTKSDVSIGSKMRELRRARMMTQKKLAAMVGVTGAQLHRYEMGTTRVSASRLISIAEALGVHPDTLMGAAACRGPSPMSLAPGGGSDDIIELINIFCGIREQKNRSALIAVARMLGGQGASAGDGKEQE